MNTQQLAKLRSIVPEMRRVRHIHFVGIGGAGMGGIAEVLANEGYQISGSDLAPNPVTQQLMNLGATIYFNHRPENVRDASVVVVSSAISADNPEIVAAHEARIPVIRRAEMLAELMRFRHGIAIAGTHGKTTTTSMASYIFLEADMDPTISVGGILKTIGGNIRVGKSGNFITEACEYTNSFLHFYPKISVILNIEEDHLDFFKDLEDIRHSFHQFSALLPSDGTLIINGDIKDYQEIYEGLDCNVITYGSSAEFDYSATEIQYDEKGFVSFELLKHNTSCGRVQLSVTGDHNVSNALAAIATAELLGIPMDTIRKGLLSFSGTDRRFEYKGTFNGVTVVDDYAHHPTEIAATLKAAQHYPHNEIWCVFQPHTYTRTKAFFHEFAEALSHTDHLVLADIYAARETDTLGISSSDLAKEAAKLGTDTHYYPSFAEIEAFLKENCKSGDLLITMGAGDVVKIGEDILK